MADAEPQVLDDATILNETNLWRRIPRLPSHLVFDENLGRWRITSAAFKDHPDGSPMSVTLDAGQQPATAIANYPGYLLAAIQAGLVRECGQGIRRVPVESDGHHAEVFGPKPQAVRSRLAKAAVWVIGP